MVGEQDPPFLNPVHGLRKVPVPETRAGRGKGRYTIVRSRLEDQRKKLGSQAQELFASREDFVTFGGEHCWLHICFPTRWPQATRRRTCLLRCLVASCWRRCTRATWSKLISTNSATLLRRSEIPTATLCRADISRVSDMGVFGKKAQMRGRSIDDLWEAAPERDGGRLFIVWLTPFGDRQAREALLYRMAGLRDDRTLLPVWSRGLPSAPGDDATSETRVSGMPRRSSIARAIRNYRNTGIGHAAVLVPGKDRLAALVASGTSSRIDPVRPLVSASPGKRPHPAPPPPPLQPGKRSDSDRRGWRSSCAHLQACGCLARSCPGSGSRS